LVLYNPFLIQIIQVLDLMFDQQSGLLRILQDILSFKLRKALDNHDLGNQKNRPQRCNHNQQRIDESSGSIPHIPLCCNPYAIRFGISILIEQ